MDHSLPLPIVICTWKSPKECGESHKAWYQRGHLCIDTCRSIHKRPLSTRAKLQSFGSRDLRIHHQLLPNDQQWCVWFSFPDHSSIPLASPQSLPLKSVNSSSRCPHQWCGLSHPWRWTFQTFEQYLSSLDWGPSWRASLTTQFT